MSKKHYPTTANNRLKKRKMYFCDKKKNHINQ